MLTQVTSLLAGGGYTVTPQEGELEQIVPKIIQYPVQLPRPSDLGDQLVIAGITIFGGFVVYVLGQIFTKFFIDPIHEQKQVIGEIADALIFYANKYYSFYSDYESGNSIKFITATEEEKMHLRKLSEKERERQNAISDKIRGLGTQLISKSYLIPFYKIFSFFHFVLPIANIIKAQRALIGLSNSVGDPSGQRRKFEEEIREALHLYDPTK